jgi:methyltransferase OMS1
MSINARRAALLVAGGGIYATAVYFTFQFLSTSDEDNKLVAVKDSHVHNPLRTLTFQKIAPSYDDQIDKDEIVMGIKLLRRSLLYFHAKGTVLEIGAGTGRNLPYYPSQVNKVVLTDTSDQMLLRAWNKLQASSDSFRDRFKIFVADASRLPYSNDSFDTVVSTFGLCSFNDPVAVLREMQRMCKPGGKILLLEHGRSKS